MPHLFLFVCKEILIDDFSEAEMGAKTCRGVFLFSVCVGICCRFSLLTVFQTSSSCFSSTTTNCIRVFRLVCPSLSRVPDFTVTAEAAGEQNIYSEKKINE